MIVRPPDEEGFHRRPLSNCCGVGVVYFRRDIGRFVGVMNEHHYGDLSSTELSQANERKRDDLASRNRVLQSLRTAGNAMTNNMSVLHTSVGVQPQVNWLGFASAATNASAM